MGVSGKNAALLLIIILVFSAIPPGSIGLIDEFESSSLTNFGFIKTDEKTVYEPKDPSKHYAVYYSDGNSNCTLTYQKFSNRLAAFNNLTQGEINKKFGQLFIKDGKSQCWLSSLKVLCAACSSGLDNFLEYATADYPSDLLYEKSLGFGYQHKGREKGFVNQFELEGNSKYFIEEGKIKYIESPTVYAEEDIATSEKKVVDLKQILENEGIKSKDFTSSIYYNGKAYVFTGNELASIDICSEKTDWIIETNTPEQYEAGLILADKNAVYLNIPYYNGEHQSAGLLKVSHSGEKLWELRTFERRVISETMFVFEQTDNFLVILNPSEETSKGLFESNYEIIEKETGNSYVITSSYLCEPFDSYEDYARFMCGIDAGYGEKWVEVYDLATGELVSKAILKKYNQLLDDPSFGARYDPDFEHYYTSIKNIEYTPLLSKKSIINNNSVVWEKEIPYGIKRIKPGIGTVFVITGNSILEFNSETGEIESEVKANVENINYNEGGWVIARHTSMRYNLYDFNKFEGIKPLYFSGKGTVAEIEVVSEELEEKPGFFVQMKKTATEILTGILGGSNTVLRKAVFTGIMPGTDTITDAYWAVEDCGIFSDKEIRWGACLADIAFMATPVLSAGMFKAGRIADNAGDALNLKKIKKINAQLANDISKYLKDAKGIEKTIQKLENSYSDEIIAEVKGAIIASKSKNIKITHMETNFYEALENGKKGETVFQFDSLATEGDKIIGIESKSLSVANMNKFGFIPENWIEEHVTQNIIKFRKHFKKRLINDYGEPFYLMEIDEIVYTLPNEALSKKFEGIQFQKMLEDASEKLEVKTIFIGID